MPRCRSRGIGLLLSGAPGLGERRIRSGLLGCPLLLQTHLNETELLIFSPPTPLPLTAGLYQSYIHRHIQSSPLLRPASPAVSGILSPFTWATDVTYEVSSQHPVPSSLSIFTLETLIFLKYMVMMSLSCSKFFHGSPLPTE